MTHEDLCRELLVERYAVPTPEYKNPPPIREPPDEAALRRYELDIAIPDETEGEIDGCEQAAQI